MGLQLEVSTAQRHALFSNFGCRVEKYTPTDLFFRYVETVKAGFMINEQGPVLTFTGAMRCMKCLAGSTVITAS